MTHISVKLSSLLVILLLGGCFAASSASAAEEFDKYAIESASVSLSTTQAGAHADLTTSFKLTEKEHRPYARTRDVAVALPPGVMGNPQRFVRCGISEFSGSSGKSECPLASQVGVTEVTLTEYGTLIEPVYNMYSPGGDIVARFGFIAGAYPTLINVRVDPTNYSLVATVEGASSSAELISAVTTLWGVPASPIHNELRLTPQEAVNHQLPPKGRSSGQPEIPFLSNPTDCGSQRQVTITATSYQLPGSPSSITAPFPRITGCEKVVFHPTFTATPTNPESSAPTGLDATLEIPQNEAPNGYATSTLKSAVVDLPQGLTINSAAADGLVACSPEEVGFGTSEPSHCPDAAKIGSAEIEVPALEHTLEGSVYQRTPEPGHLFRFWLVTDEQGVHLKLPAEIEANALTGQLRTIFAGISSLGGNPQVPVEALRLHIFGGPRAPLATPASCGTYQTHFEFTPWSGNPPSFGDTPMQITGGCGKGGFAPTLDAGMVSLRAGSYSTFTMTLTRNDGEANPQGIEIHLPQGLLARLGGIPLCPEADAASASCPESSRVGSLAAATGVGGAPLWIPQPGRAPTAVYLGGPYKGAPYSLISRVSAQAGPFDLGTVVNRAGIYVDPETALATIVTDPLPQILEGVPIAYRAIHVEVDRKHFTLNPTDCSAKEIKATVAAAVGTTATASSSFQATNCAKLAYKPKLKISLDGSSKRTGHPALKAVLTQGKGQANTAAATVQLPDHIFIDQAHIADPCTRVQFAEERCPKLSVLGHATAHTPLLREPLKGPVYFRSNGSARELPDVVADLRGPIHIVLVGYVDSVPVKGTELARIRTRFAHVPDAPVTKFTMSLFGGKRGLLVNSANLCKVDHRAKVGLMAQNGRSHSSQQSLAPDCGH
ncbi:MAG: hypothetical protein ACTHK6_05305 [Solirubrobacterales bacterium]